MRTMVGVLMVLVMLAGCATSPARRAASEPAQQTATAAPAYTPPADDPLPYDIGAIAANAFYVPGKVVLCVIGAAFGTGILAVTAGSGYGGAAGFVREGCGGKWIVTGEDVRRETGKRYWGPN